MPDDRPPRPATVSSVFRNLYALVAAGAPRSAALLLGSRWSFGLPCPALREALTEYSLPFGPQDYPATVARRTGLRIVEHTGDEQYALADHLAGGAAAVVAVDCFYLRHRPAFGRVHSARTLLVRPGPGPDQVEVDDGWDPVYRGPVPWPELQRARYSDVPLDPVREPVFAGRPTAGAWFSVQYTPTPVAEPAGWGAEFLRELSAEAVTSGCDARGQYGLAALLTLAEECRRAGHGDPAARFDWARQASLLLRAELSSRVFLRVFVQAVAHWRSDPRLRTAAADYRQTLHALERARDLLVKSLHRPELGCLDWAAEWLRSASAGEARLVEQIQRLPSAAAAPHHVSSRS
ncbi:MAG TPA: hypothetical protein VFU36_09130 [Jatrophihabitans sp.]|nr:hypothetical protein [Jatrophihabitans sp.]